VTPTIDETISECGWIQERNPLETRARCGEIWYRRVTVTWSHKCRARTMPYRQGAVWAKNVWRLRILCRLRMLVADGAVEARGAVEAERSDPGMNG